MAGPLDFFMATSMPVRDRHAAWWTWSPAGMCVCEGGGEGGSRGQQEVLIWP